MFKVSGLSRSREDIHLNLERMNGQDLANMLKAGCANLELHKEKVNAMNVFPVPDGDTGTNMYLTLVATVKEVEKEKSTSIGTVAQAMARGSLMGARGNSGVILSQVFRGMVKYLDGKEEITSLELGRALQAGCDTAYRAVMKPVEGTILTVVKEIARAAVTAAGSGLDIIGTLQAGLDQGRKTLAKTPEMLPILREAGVVDAGGQGLLYFLEGALNAWSFYESGQVVDVAKETGYVPQDVREAGKVDLEFRYCTEVLIQGQKLDQDAIRDRLLGIGDSLLVVGDDSLIKVHIHSNHPGKVLEACIEFGSLHDIKINNMQDESEERQRNLTEESNIIQDSWAEPKRRLGVVAVAAGTGINEIFKSLGVDQVVEGGQTMNPSTEELVRACEAVNAEQVIILPNNSNVILAAEQAKYLCQRRIEVVPTRSITEGMAALIAYDAEGDPEGVISAMKERMASIKSAEITYAVRDTVINGIDMKAGNIIGLVDGEVRVAGETVEAVVLNLLREIVDPDTHELITLIYGEHVAAEDAEALKTKVGETFPFCEVDLHFGGQPHYHYFISVE